MFYPLCVLTIGADTPDFHSLAEAFRSYGVSHQHVSPEEDGSVAFYFYKERADAMFVPTLIMLDNDTCQSASVLGQLKHHSVLRRIPVIIYGRNNNPEVVTLTYQLGAACYMPRPDNWSNAMMAFCSYWQKRVAFPAIRAEDILL
ncbi:hypothetical protein [Larkinella arboricola]